ncbi:MAG TPA: winged helix-turn-helix domain-containing protein [Nitrososphaeraceae archaeon]|nr:winged helix-turn-helix domain-containing protein [Nitrososphaeraceae archaeon]
MITSIEERTTRKRLYKKHRSKEEIVANILKAALKKTTKTRIMRRTYISYNLLQKYLSYASVNGLILYDHRSNEYQISSKGIQYLDYFNQYRDIESDLALKKSMISQMLEINGERSIVPNIEYGRDGMLTHRAA